MKQSMQVFSIVALMLCICGGSVQAEPLHQSPLLATPAAGLTDPAELEAFLDGFLASELAENHIAGATVAIVKDGELFFAKGYGYADVEQQIPVDARKTLFRVGSVTKLFTWTAVMQLVEQGRLDLNADVNTYLDFVIPDTYPEPITLIHLLTHTPGFEDRGFGMAAASPQELVPNGEWLADNIPARVRPPGEFSAYSNYGTALAGYIVELVSGMPYDDYIEQYILSPLGMKQSTSRQPLPEALAPDMSKGYRFVNAGHEAQDFELINVAPAGSFSATATDMARFMIAHLQDGAYDGNRILEETTAQRMHSRLFTHDERLNGFAHGFYEMSQNDQWVVGHEGDTAWFHTMLALLPEHNIGFFASYNSASDTAPRALLEAFMDRYYPVPEKVISPPADFAERAGRFTGSYALNRASYTTAEKVQGLFVAISVRAADDGTLLVNSPLGQQRFVEVAPLLFQEVGGADMLLFREDGRGRITHAFLDSVPMMAIEKLAWYQAPAFHQVLVGVGLLLFLSVFIAGVVGFLINRGREDVEKPPRPARLARWLQAGAAMVWFLQVLLFFIGMSDQIALMTGNAPIMMLLPAVGLLFVLLTVGTLLSTALAWWKGYWNLPGRLHYTLVTLVAVALIWVMNYWNLLGWNL
jgi:CubicO group peptidase (beta-lactamase class C family)